GKPARRGSGQKKRGVVTMWLCQGEIEQRFAERGQPFHRVSDADATRDALPGCNAVLHEGVQKRILVREVTIECHGRELRPLRHAADGEPLDACGFEHCLGGRQYAVLGHAYTVHSRCVLCTHAYSPYTPPPCLSQPSRNRSRS